MAYFLKQMTFGLTFKAYNELDKNTFVDKVDEMLNAPISCNENIRIDNKIILYRKLLDKGIYALRHVLERNGNFPLISVYTQIQLKHKFCFLHRMSTSHQKIYRC